MAIITVKKYALVSLLSAALLSSVFAAAVSAQTFTALTSQLALGSTGADVTNLQTFLASSSSIYPQGLITGYFGPLTQQAVKNFQAAYGIAQVGAVGPITLAKINSLITSGVGLTGGGSGNAPIIYSPSVSTSRTTATVSWVTDKPAIAEVYYNAAPFQLTEAIGAGEPTISGGSVTAETSIPQTSQNISISGLQPNTIYYYIIESTDSSGNLQYTWPATFMTTP